MNLRVKIAGGLIGFALSLGGAAAQTTPTPAATPAATAKPAASAPAVPRRSRRPRPSPPRPRPRRPPTPPVRPPRSRRPPPRARRPRARRRRPTPPRRAPPPFRCPSPRRRSRSARPPPPPPPLETALSTDPTPTLQPDTFFATAKAAERYAAIVQAGGWPTDIPALRPGAKGAAVAKLRKRLAIEGDLDARRRSKAPQPQIWDKDLTEAVKTFPGAHGAAADRRRRRRDAEGDQRARRDRATTNSPPARSGFPAYNFEFGDRYVVVNLPSTSVEAVENGKVVHRYVAIVGDPEHPSPEISAHISVINLNPTWTVPTSIIKKEIIPQMQRDPGYLAARQDPHPRRLRQRDRSALDRLEHQARGQLHAAPGFRRRQFARLDPHRHAQQARRLHARHARQGAVRRRLPLPQPRLRARAGRLRLRGMAARGHAGRPGRRLGQGGAARQGEGAARARTSSSPRPCR